MSKLEPRHISQITEMWHTYGVVGTARKIGVCVCTIDAAISTGVKESTKAKIIAALETLK